MKIDRLIGILSLLLRQEQVTTPALAERFEVSPRTIRRDIDTLCRAGIPLVTTRGRDGGISLLPGYRVDRTLLTTPELQAILAGLGSLDSVSATRRYARLMEKLSPGQAPLAPGGEHLLIDLSSWYKTSLPPKFEAIRAAIEAARTIAFTYFSPKGETRRRAEPYTLVFHWSAWYVWAWCLVREDFRLFKLNRMTDLTVGEPFSPRPAPPPDLTPERVFPPVWQVEILFEPACRWRLVEEYGADRFTSRPDGKLVFRGAFPDQESVFSWLLTFGDQAELLAPAELRRDLAQLTRQLAQRYERSPEDGIS